jgi:excisionase family DNA binding protein
MPEITVNEAAAILGIHPQSVRDALQEGRLKGRKIGVGRGGMWLVEKDCLPEYKVVGHRPKKTEE